MSQLYDVENSAGKSRPKRSRRGSRPSGDDRELAILATAERLLEERPLSDISIDDLAKGAGISRPTFYFYFPSKDAVLLSLLDRVVAEADAVAFAPTDAADPRRCTPAAQWREAINAFFVTFGAHRSVTMASWSARASNPEVRALWSRVMENWVRHTEEAIQAERDRGAAPDHLPVHDLAVALNYLNERVMAATFTGDQPAIEDGKVVDTLLQIWLTSIYQTTTPE